MKYEEYARPDLEEIEIELEGSFLNDSTGVKIKDETYEGGDEGDGWD